MRTTLTIDDELLAGAKVLAARTHRTIGSVVEEALRRMLTETSDPQPVVLPDYSYSGGLRAGVDLYDKELLDQLLGESSR